MKRWQKSLYKLADTVNKRLMKTLIFIILALVFFFAMFSNVRPEQLHVEPLTIAEQTIRSPITIEDKEMTEKKRNEVIEQIQAVYVTKQEYAENRVQLITQIFDSAIDIVKKAEQEQLENELKLADDPEFNYSPPTTAEKLDALKDEITEAVASELSNSSLRALVNSTVTNLSIARDAAVTAVNNAMTKDIPANQVENAKKQVEDEIRYISLPADLKNATIELGRYAIIQNQFYDPDLTNERKQQAADSVEPVRILQGQIIIEQGKLVTPDAYRQLDLLGLLDDKQPVLPFVGLGLLVLILLFVTYSFLHDDLKKPNNVKELLIFSVIIITTIILMKLISIIPYNKLNLTYIFPAALCAMLMKILLNERKAYLSVIILAVTGTIIFNDEASGSFNFAGGLYILISSLSSILFLTNRNQRSKIFQAGLFVSLTNIIIIAVLLMIPNSQFTISQYVSYFLLGLASGIGSSILTIGLIPFFEAGFGILSSMKLIELSNPNHPLLKKILTETPGTYHHSVMVANLADAACEAIGANGLLARVSSYYHDIGKTKRPSFFIENQMNVDNPHDSLDPVISKDIIIAHTTDGAEILRKHRMPKEIIDIAQEHHGTSMVKYFYYKAKEAGYDLPESDFRYPGPKPQTKEAAIINIADSVEAAVRSMSNPNMEKIANLVKNIIKDRLNDEQFNECNITLKELKIVENTLCETLHGIFHSRIEYPKTNKEG